MLISELTVLDLVPFALQLKDAAVELSNEHLLYKLPAIHPLPLGVFEYRKDTSGL